MKAKAGQTTKILKLALLRQNATSSKKQRNLQQFTVGLLTHDFMDHVGLFEAHVSLRCFDAFVAVHIQIILN